MSNMLCVPTGVCFGGNTSPNPWEVIAWARSLLAAAFFKREDLLLKHADWLKQVQFTPPPGEDTEFSNARRDYVNAGVIHSDGSRCPSQHNTFVDDNLMAETQEYIRYAIVASIKALFILLGFPEAEKRRVALSAEKFIKSACSYKRVQLGILVDTRSMTVSLPDDKRNLICNEIKRWHRGRKSATLRELAILMGRIVNLATICHWGRYLVTELQHSITVALRVNKKHVSLTSEFAQLMEKIQELSTGNGEASLNKIYFYSSQISKRIWSCKVWIYLTKELRAELLFLHTIFSKPDKYFWGTKIGHLIPRRQSYEAWGDSSLDAGGGFSPDLLLWWSVT